MTEILAALTVADAVIKYVPLVLTTADQVGQLVERLVDRKRTLEGAAGDRRAADDRLDADLAAAGLAADLAIAPPPATGADDLTDVAATVIRQSAEIQRLRDDNQRLANQLAAEQAGRPVIAGGEDTAEGGPNNFGPPPAPEP